MSPVKHRQHKRERARALFLTGECDANAEIARRVGLKPHTVARYRTQEGWDDLRLKIDRQAAEKLVESLAGERVNLNLRHYRYWEALLVQIGELLKTDPDLGIRELERLAAVLDRAQKGQRLARGLSLTGETEEQIRAKAEAENRLLVDAFIDAVKTVPDEGLREDIRQAVLARLPAAEEDEVGEAPS